MDRVIAYLDGFNLYHGLIAKDWGRYRWLDLHAVVNQRIRAGQELVAVKYFTSEVAHDPAALKRQQTFLRALEVRKHVTVIKGSFESRPVRCQSCNTWSKRRQEKRTDVNIATHLLRDAYLDNFDSAYLISADADLVPAVELVQRELGKRVVLIDPPRRHSDELAALADCHWHFAPKHMKAAQLPNPVEHFNTRGKLQRIYCPDGWMPTE